MPRELRVRRPEAGDRPEGIDRREQTVDANATVKTIWVRINAIVHYSPVRAKDAQQSCIHSNFDFFFAY